MKDVRRSFLALFGVALVVAVVGRIGLAVMDLAGVLTYDYIAASTGTLLNQVCSALVLPVLPASPVPLGTAFPGIPPGSAYTRELPGTP